MLVNISDKHLYHRKVYMTYDGTIWVPLKEVKESFNSIRTAKAGKCTIKKLTKMLEATNIVPTKFYGSSSLYITWTEYNDFERQYIEHTLGGDNNEIFNLRV